MMIVPVLSLSLAALPPSAQAAAPVLGGAALVSSTPVSADPPPTVPTLSDSAAPTVSEPDDDPLAAEGEQAAPAGDAAPAPDDAALEPAQNGPDELDHEPVQLDLDKDPLEGFNRVSFHFSMAVDKVVIRPAAMVYRHVVPKPLRDGAHNALSNLGEPVVFLNDFLQLRPDRMVRTLGRFLINSIFGLGGLFDVAKHKPYNLPHHANGLGDTLGYYGVKAGPYIYVPILGPTTLRDAIGSSEDLVPPAVIGGILKRQDYQITTSVVDGLDKRERNDDDLKTMLDGAIDKYATFRANYLQDRAGEIADLKSKSVEPGQTTAPVLDDPLTDPAEAPPSPSENQPPPQ